MKNLSVNIKGKLHYFHTPWVMGIINVTPDSFYAESRSFDQQSIHHRIANLIEQGADAIDIGGYSSRPGADNVSPEEEYSRLASALEITRKYFPDTIVSIDTFRADVARKCVTEWQADIINDISGGIADKDMWETVAELKVPYILMHMRGTPKTMQSHCEYTDVTSDVIKDLAAKTDKMRQLGITDIIIDPGFGFAKTLEQNYALMAELQEFKRLDMPLLVGISHKSMIYKALDIKPEDALNGTTILNTIALTKGVDILRVHDVREAKEAIKIIKLLKENSR